MKTSAGPEETGLRLGAHLIKQLAALYQSLIADEMVIDYNGVAEELNLDNAEDAKSLYDDIVTRLTTTQHYEFDRPALSRKRQLEDAENHEQQHKQKHPKLSQDFTSIRVSDPHSKRSQPRILGPLLDHDSTPGNNRYRDKNFGRYPEYIRHDMDYLLFVLTQSKHPLKFDWPTLAKDSGKTEKAV